jgi:hypothetical protein
MLRCSPNCEGEVSDMKKTERVRQVVSTPLGEADLKQQAEKGWRLVAVEWEREIETAEAQLHGDVPFGLQIAADRQGLEENPAEREILSQLMWNSSFKKALIPVLPRKLINGDSARARVQNGVPWRSSKCCRG